MDCGLVLFNFRPSAFPGSWYLFLMRHLTVRYQSPQPPQAKQALKRSFACHIIMRHSRSVDFLHHENPPTCAGVEPAILGVEGQQQTNHATQPAAKALRTPELPITTFPTLHHIRVVSRN
ncbi:hypothetical protein TNCV_416641 [Trichonephila clavipes]|nr:hypothetical protein TNCV_416641 [Trichonephila clavipes]